MTTTNHAERGAPPLALPGEAGLRGPAAALLPSDLLARLEALDLVARRVLGGEGAGRRRSPRRGFGGDFRGHRAYAPGDDLRTVDWNAAARLGPGHAPWVKEFEAEGTLQLAVVLDRTGSLAAPPGLAAPFARAVAAAVAYLGLTRTDGVDLVLVPGGSSEAGGATFRGRARARALLDAIGGAEAGGTGSLAGAAPLSPRGGGGLAVVVSDFWDLGDLERALGLWAARRTEVALLHVASPAEGLPAAGEYAVRDAETGRETRVRFGRDLADRYRAAAARHAEAVRRLALSREARHARLDPREPLEEAVLRLARAGVIR
ncbi:MAG: DUF58 domain-containing protein [Planctomycetales bacterium]|nr:DUF58 domain-containing protein [Planctomycetales bacterium]